MKSQYKEVAHVLLAVSPNDQELLQSQSPLSVCYCLTIKVPYLWCCLHVTRWEETFREYSGWNRMAWFHVDLKRITSRHGVFYCRRVSHMILDSVVGRWYYYVVARRGDQLDGWRAILRPRGFPQPGPPKTQREHKQRQRKHLAI